MIPASDSKQLNVEIPEDLFREVKIRAATDGTPVRELVANAIRAYLRSSKQARKNKEVSNA